MRPQKNQELAILSWNICGARTKLEKSEVLSILLNYDGVSLNEVKTDLPVSVPGYISYRSTTKGSAYRGGTVVLIKNYIVDSIAEVDTAIEDQVWIRFCFSPRTLFGFCYVPPPDSQYYSNN